MVAHKSGELRFSGDLAGLSDANVLAKLLAPLCRIKWVVYAKRPVRRQVLAYLSRYTHRVAISNRRLVACDATRAIVTMDNRSPQKEPRIREMIEAAGATLLRLPPYSPTSIRSRAPSPSSKQFCEGRTNSRRSLGC